MSYRLKQENFHKPVTAEAIKVLRVIANERTDILSLMLPYISPAGDVIGETPGRMYYPNQHPGRVVGSIVQRRRCRLTTCFCTLTRLQANLIIRYLIRSSPAKRRALREWRIQRATERGQRRLNRTLEAASIFVNMTPLPTHTYAVDPAQPPTQDTTTYSVRYQSEEEPNA